MKDRLNAYAVIPDVAKRASALQGAIDAHEIDKKLLELIKIRVSQINGCAYCLHMHTHDALELGETQVRIFVLSGWYESTLFSASERAVLAYAERLTRISENGAIEELFSALKEHFSEQQIAVLSTEIAMINFWNRWAIGFGSVHPAEAAEHV
jgi:AhpD family alkylhydroperoxidase